MGASMKHAAKAAVALALVSIVTAGCSVELNRTPPVRLRIIAVPETASVYLNEEFLGSARVLAVRPEELPRGHYRLTITAPGYFPHDMMIELAPGTTTVRIKLRAIPK